MRRELLFTIRMNSTRERELNGNLNVPNYLKERFYKLEPDSSLDVEMGRYILHYANGWAYPMGAGEYWNTIPVMNKKEAIEFLKEAVRVEEEE